MYLRQLEPAEVSLENRKAGERPSQVNFHRPTRCFSQTAPRTTWTPELEDHATSSQRGKGRGGAGRACNAHRGRVPEAAHPARPSLGRTVAIRSPGRSEGRPQMENGAREFPHLHYRRAPAALPPTVYSGSGFVYS